MGGVFLVTGLNDSIPLGGAFFMVFIRYLFYNNPLKGVLHTKSFFIQFKYIIKYIKQLQRLLAYFQTGIIDTVKQYAKPGF